jgi:hypothetical protein
MKDETGEGGGRKEKGSKDGTDQNRKYKFDVRQEPDARESSRSPNSRRTELSLQTTPRDVLTKLLNTQISLTAGEILGTSRELSIALADQIRVKNVTAANAAANHTCANHGSLLRVPVRVGRYTYNAIIDSGSEVNLIKRRVWENDLKVPMDVGASMTLHDANGGTSTLKGIIPDLELKIGGLITTSNYWVTTTCPLDILLGRPWQRQNLVSIDERTEGTYLRFNKVNGDRVMEILVMPHEETHSHHTSGHAAPHNSYLGLTGVEPTLALPRCDSHHLISSHTMTAVNPKLEVPKGYKQEKSESERDEPKSMTTEAQQMIQRTYFQVFQPEPNLLDYGLPPHYLDNTRLGSVASRVHSAVGNHMSKFLTLNSAQYKTLLPSVRNVFHTYKHVHIIHSELPDVNSDSTTWEVVLPTVRLPEDARKITSPVPFTVFSRLGNPSDPFLPLYQFHVERYNGVHNPIPVPPLNVRFTNGLTHLTNLSLL